MGELFDSYLITCHVSYNNNGAIGYYNPLIAYGEEKAVSDAEVAGANGYIMVDLPPEEALKFRNICASTG